MMTNTESGIEVMACVAAECGRLEAFERELRRDPAFRDVTGGLELIHERQGWRLERYVEARSKEQPDCTVAWWLELTSDGARWRIVTNSCSSHGNYALGREVRLAAPGELRRELHAAVSALVQSGLPAWKQNPALAGQLMVRLCPG